MTQNQLAYQANKIKEREAGIKQYEADTKAAKTASDIELARSEHIHEYKDIYSKPSDNPDLMGQKTFKDLASGWQSIFKSAGEILKGVATAGALFK